MSRPTLQRGDIVIVDFVPTNPAAHVRPALIVQNDRDNLRMSNTIVVQITSNLRRAGEQTQLLIDHSHVDWPGSGLRRPSVVNCSNLATVGQHHFLRVIGRLSQQTMDEVAECLKAALALS